jgi:uncharacterized protein YmfQ (DUF2313 family)
VSFRRLFDAFAQVLAGVEVRALALLEETDVRTALELLPEWLELLDVFGDCNAGPPDTLAEQRFAAYVKLTLPGGQNAFHLSEVARLLGYDVDVEDFEEPTAFVAGSSAGDLLYSDGWAFAVIVHAPIGTPRFARTGLSVCGEPLCSFGNEPLVCALERVKPAHVVLVFSFDKPYVGYSPWNVILPDAVELDVALPSSLRT